MQLETSHGFWTSPLNTCLSSLHLSNILSRKALEAKQSFLKSFGAQETKVKSLGPARGDYFCFWCPIANLCPTLWQLHGCSTPGFNSESHHLKSLVNSTLDTGASEVKWALGKLHFNHKSSWNESDARKDWRKEEKGETKDRMVGWHHWLKEHEFEQSLGDSEGQGRLARCSSWGCKESDTI